MSEQSMPIESVTEDVPVTESDECDYCDYSYYNHHHCYWCGYTIVMSRVRNDGADEWEHVINGGWSVHEAKP